LTVDQFGFPQDDAFPFDRFTWSTKKSKAANKLAMMNVCRKTEN
jgi:hypothetical protein